MSAFIILLLFTDLPSVLDGMNNSKPVKLETALPIETTSDRLLVNDRGEIILVSYWHSRILMFDSSGNFIRNLAGSGDGPGEVREPCFALPIEEIEKGGKRSKRMVIIEGGQPRAHVFDMNTGKFIKQINGFPMANKWVSNGRSFASLHNGIASKHLFFVHDKDFAVVQKIGEKDPIPRFDFLSRRFAMAYDSNGKVYYQEGSQPEIHVYENGRDTYRNWKLKAPRHFREFKAPMDTRKTGMNRNKAVEHMKSFTHLNALMIDQNSLLIVEWLTWEPTLKSFDFYDLESRRLLHSDFGSDADLTTCANGKLYLLNASEDDENNGQHLLSVFSLHGLASSVRVLASSHAKSGAR